MNQDSGHVDFDLFYAENAMPAYRFALRLSGDVDDAEDLAAQALTKAYFRWSQFKNEATARTWLFAIVVNEWRMLCRSRPQKEEDLESIRNLADTFKIADLDLAAAIQALPEPLREAFLLVKGEGLTHAEAAHVLRVPVGTMYFRVHAAVRKLRYALGGELARTESEVICKSEL